MTLVNLWPDIASYMDDNIRESVHTELAPCTAVIFLFFFCLICIKIL